ncbi:MAG TPA: hypothetical protein VHP11_17360, partial [Tepidisphaeraceae bacterium]|nr:hypothetical protein [Tepidisphaeraceae bacterium]
MTTPEKTEAGSRSESCRRRKPVIIVAVVAAAGVLIALTLMGWRWLGNRPPAPTDDPLAIAKFAATDNFAQMSLAQKELYLRTLRANMTNLVAAARSGKLTREEQIAAVRNGFKAGARVEMANYFALPPGPARQAHLDKLIDEQEQMRAHAAQSPNGGAFRSATGIQVKQFLEALPPGERVQMAKFGYDLFQRR